VLVIVYMAAFSLLTVYLPEAKRSIVIGYECLPNLPDKYKLACPFLSAELLSDNSYDEFQFYTKTSIMISRVILLTLWFAIFVCLAILIGQFLVHQRQRLMPTPS
jgi:hypothetical protein